MKPAAAWSERELQSYVQATAKQLGLLCYHTHDSRRSEPGFPDCVLVGPAGLLFAELKAERGRLTVEQRRWGSKLAQAGAAWTVWRPRDALDGTVTRMILRLVKEAA